jgi:phosphoserine phosphatase RsbU/P
MSITMSLPNAKIPLETNIGWPINQNRLIDAKILVVDDSPLIRELIGACLMTDGYKNISFAEDGEDALVKIAGEIPDLIILDLEMPKMDGFEVCKRLRASPETRNIPILIQSGRDTATDVTRAFEYGANDMVVKPIKKFEILARAKVHLENRFLLEKLTSFHDRVALELEQAKNLQLDICPSAEELSSYREQYGVKIGWHYEPSSELGGDIGGVFPVSDTKLAVYIADFSGHGVAAALNTFRMQTWLASASEDFDRPHILLEKLNNFLCKNLNKGSYATMLFCCLDLENGQLHYAAAGCQPPLLQLPDKSSNFEICDSRGMPLGLRENWQYRSTTLPFTPNTKFLLYSDALVEVETSPDVFLGDEGLRDEVSQIWRTKPNLTQRMHEVVKRFRSRLGGEPPDDLTIIYMENINENSHL